MNFNNLMKGVPKIGGEKPLTNMSSEAQQLRVLGEVGEKVKTILDLFDKELETYNYIRVIQDYAKFLQTQIINAGLKNKEVPLVWQLFQQRYSDKISKLTPEQQSKSLPVEIFAPIWNVMTQEHNQALQEFPFSKFYGENK